MDEEKWLRRLRNWLALHPVKEPPDSLKSGYTEEVMARIRQAQVPQPYPTVFAFPRLSFALGTALACALLLLVVAERSKTHKDIEQINETAQLLEQLDPEDSSLLTENGLSDEELLEELILLDQIELGKV